MNKTVYTRLILVTLQSNTFKLYKIIMGSFDNVISNKTYNGVCRRPERHMNYRLKNTDLAHEMMWLPLQVTPTINQRKKNEVCLHNLNLLSSQYWVWNTWSGGVLQKDLNFRILSYLLGMAISVRTSCRTKAIREQHFLTASYLN